MSKQDKIIEVLARTQFHTDWPHRDWEATSSTEKQQYRINARKQLAALEDHKYHVMPVEPTENMIEAGYNAPIDAYKVCKNPLAVMTMIIKPTWEAMAYAWKKEINDD